MSLAEAMARLLRLREALMPGSIYNQEEGLLSPGAERERNIAARKKTHLFIFGGLALASWAVHVYLMLGAPGLLETPPGTGQTATWASGNTVYAGMIALTTILSASFLYVLVDFWRLTEEGSKLDSQRSEG